MGDAEFMSDSRAAARPRWRDQRLGELPPRGGKTWAVVPVVLWGAAAVLAVIAPFLQLWVLALPSGRVRTSDGVDGWGRVGAATFGSHQPHEPRFGILLWACALGLAWLAVQRGRALRRADPGLDPVTAGTAIGVPCLLAGVTGCLVLYVQDYADKFGRRLAQSGGELHVRWGWGLWLSLASLAFAVAATTILFRPSRSPTGDSEPDLDEVGSADR
ncbi:MAG TPA: hypothetical protein VGO19_04840 [Actinomycetes bacterium]|jgi:hypothetical protein